MTTGVDYFDRIETQLADAAHKRRRRRRFGRLGGPLAIAGAVVVAGGAAVAATGGLNLGSPEPQPKHSAEAAAVGVGVPPAAGVRDAKVLGVRAEDPDGGPPWGIRTFVSSRGVECAQFGQIVENRLVKRGSDGLWHERALRCETNTGGYGWGAVDGELHVQGFTGPRGRQAIIERSDGPTLTVPVRDGAFLALVSTRSKAAHIRKITIVLDDGSRHRLTGPDATPVPGSEPSPRKLHPPVDHVPVAVAPRTVAHDGSIVVKFRAPAAIREASQSFRVEINGPHRKGCSGRGIAATDRNYDAGDVVRVRMRAPGVYRNGELYRLAEDGWCAGRFKGRVALDRGRTLVGEFSVTVR